MNFLNIFGSAWEYETGLRPSNKDPVSRRPIVVDHTDIVILPKIYDVQGGCGYGRV